ncbi:hypothetical protein L6452_06428 [Arctium lappa]|uniref:Uncharacterized protein n=1 Tax=Arctium lappa TaxID=4217 RepID=A0ACB9EJJ6_ARCLA|nr:hypothetical protein L6452_06428 [Arctium lappa]
MTLIRSIRKQERSKVVGYTVDAGLSETRLLGRNYSRRRTKGLILKSPLVGFIRASPSIEETLIHESKLGQGRWAMVDGDGQRAVVRGDGRWSMEIDRERWSGAMVDGDRQSDGQGR